MAQGQQTADERGEPSDVKSAAGRPPGPSGPPLVGNTFQLIGDPFGFYERLRTEFDADVMTYTVAGDRAYMLTHPDDVERVLLTDASDFRKGKVFDESLGRITPNGLVVTEGEQWQRDRTLLQPMFYRERIEAYADTMTAYSREAAESWAPGEPLRIDDEMRDLTLDVFSETLLGTALEERKQAVRESTTTLFARFETSSLMAFLPLWIPTPSNYRAKKALSRFHDVVDEMVDERRATLADESGTLDEPAAHDRDDLLSLMLTATYEDGGRMDRETVRDQLMTFLAAGHETTSLALSYAIFCLANHPEKQAKLHRELDEQLNGEPTAADLFQLDYLDDVLTETLRLYPPAFVVFREPKEDVTIRGYDVEAGSILSLPQWNIHRDERWFEEPEEFRPERWGDGLEDEIPDYAYFPFGGGPRHCIGMRFALMEAKLALATMLQRFEFEAVTEPPLDLRMMVTMQPADGIDVVPRER